ncbi:molybdopterin molybdotransferase MoeA [Texcoconibacillus texcoconensis]|uniref:Molybdopterin molybdenumtransferase n=1 Tax=Texcoconibacillus texcoconensis TaxID=1095777 RepID=A0A840QNB7_9BACI|nr:gephyrin-like molybdotransferase Glp [Texcoconibacillus texcoconensis]MBB5172831.1 molybdopterin molybdotransferase [Texcoconibacillus texcoconensis]
MKFYRVKTAEETWSYISEQIKPISRTTNLPIDEALHRTLSNDIVAKEAVPSFSRSTVDGYAVRAKDTYGASEMMPGFLSVTGEVKMGEEATISLSAGEAIYVPTGAMIPEGSDAVVMIEYCEQTGDMLQVMRSAAPRENIIFRGEDVEDGEVLLQKGHKLRTQELGALASLGVREVPVYETPKIGYLSSGDEIVPYDQVTLNAGEIRDVNGLTIPQLAKQAGFDCIYGGVAPDDFSHYYEKAKQLLDHVDILLLSGGSSVGEKDFTTRVIESLGDGEASIDIHGISVKPGKPTIFGRADEKTIVGLPGHPASAMVIYQMFVQPLLRRLSGQRVEPIRPSKVAKVSENIPSTPGRTDYIRVQLVEDEGELFAKPILGKSGLMKTLVKSDGLLEIDSKKEGVLKGDQVQVTLF